MGESSSWVRPPAPVASAGADGQRTTEQHNGGRLRDRRGGPGDLREVERLVAADRVSERGGGAEAQRRDRRGRRAVEQGLQLSVLGGVEPEQEALVASARERGGEVDARRQIG